MRLTQYLFAHKGGGTGGAGSHAHMQKYLPISRSLRNGASELMVRQCPHAPPPLQAGGCSATSCGQRLPPLLAVPSTCAVACDVCKVSRCMLVATDQHAKPKNRTPRSRRCAHHAARAAETRPTLRGRHQSPRTRMPCRGGHPVPSASQRPLQKTTIHMLKLGRIARLGAVNKRTGKIPVIRPSRRSVVCTKSHPICLSCSCAPKICRRSARRISRQKRRMRRAQPAALVQHGVGSTHAKRHMFLSRFAHTLAVVG